MACPILDGTGYTFTEMQQTTLNPGDSVPTFTLSAIAQEGFVLDADVFYVQAYSALIDVDQVTFTQNGNNVDVTIPLTITEWPEDDQELFVDIESSEDPVPITRRMSTLVLPVNDFRTYWMDDDIEIDITSTGFSFVNEGVCGTQVGIPDVFFEIEDGTVIANLEDAAPESLDYDIGLAYNEDDDVYVLSFDREITENDLENIVGTPGTSLELNLDLQEAPIDENIITPSEDSFEIDGQTDTLPVAGGTQAFDIFGSPGATGSYTIICDSSPPSSPASKTTNVIVNDADGCPLPTATLTEDYAAGVDFTLDENGMYSNTVTYGAFTGMGCQSCTISATIGAETNTHVYSQCGDAGITVTLSSTGTQTPVSHEGAPGDLFSGTTDPHIVWTVSGVTLNSDIDYDTCWSGDVDSVFDCFETSAVQDGANVNITISYRGGEIPTSDVEFVLDLLCVASGEGSATETGTTYTVTASPDEFTFGANDLGVQQSSTVEVTPNIGTGWTGAFTTGSLFSASVLSSTVNTPTAVVFSPLTINLSESTDITDTFTITSRDDTSKTEVITLTQSALVPNINHDIIGDNILLQSDNPANVDFTITSDVDWQFTDIGTPFVIQDDGGAQIDTSSITAGTHTFTIVPEDRTDLGDVTVDVTFTAGSATSSFTITQLGSAQLLDVDPLLIGFPADLTTAETVTIEYNNGYTIEINDPDNIFAYSTTQNRAEGESGTDTFTITPSENSGDERSATIDVELHDGSQARRITIVQYQFEPFFEFDPINVALGPGVTGDNASPNAVMTYRTNYPDFDIYLVNPRFPVYFFSNSNTNIRVRDGVGGNTTNNPSANTIAFTATYAAGVGTINLYNTTEYTGDYREFTLQANEFVVGIPLIGTATVAQFSNNGLIVNDTDGNTIPDNGRIIVPNGTDAYSFTVQSVITSGSPDGWTLTFGNVGADQIATIDPQISNTNDEIPSTITFAETNPSTTEFLSVIGTYTLQSNPDIIVRVEFDQAPAPILLTTNIGDGNGDISATPFPEDFQDGGTLNASSNPDSPEAIVSITSNHTWRARMVSGGFSTDFGSDVFGGAEGETITQELVISPSSSPAVATGQLFITSEVSIEGVTSRFSTIINLEKDANIPENVVVDPTDLLFESEGGTMDISVTSEYDDWIVSNFTSPSGILHFSYEILDNSRDNGMIRITAPQSNTTSQYGSFRVVSSLGIAHGNVGVSLIQRSLVEELSGPSVARMNADQTFIDVPIVGNTSWRVFSSSNTDILATKVNETTLRIEDMLGNAINESNRSSTITLLSEFNTVSHAIGFTHLGFDVVTSVSPSTLMIAQGTGMTTTTTVTSNHTWDITNVNGGAGFTVSPTSGGTALSSAPIDTPITVTGIFTNEDISSGSATAEYNVNSNDSDEFVPFTVEQPAPNPVPTRNIDLFIRSLGRNNSSVNVGNPGVDWEYADEDFFEDQVGIIDADPGEDMSGNKDQPEWLNLTIDPKTAEAGTAFTVVVRYNSLVLDVNGIGSSFEADDLIHVGNTITGGVQVSNMTITESTEVGLERAYVDVTFDLTVPPSVAIADDNYEVLIDFYVLGPYNNVVRYGITPHPTTGDTGVRASNFRYFDASGSTVGTNILIDSALKSGTGSTRGSQVPSFDLIKFYNSSGTEVGPADSDIVEWVVFYCTSVENPDNQGQFHGFHFDAEAPTGQRFTGLPTTSFGDRINDYGFPNSYASNPNLSAAINGSNYDFGNIPTTQWTNSRAESFPAPSVLFWIVSATPTNNSVAGIAFNANWVILFNGPRVGDTSSNRRGQQLDPTSGGTLYVFNNEDASGNITSITYTPGIVVGRHSGLGSTFHDTHLFHGWVRQGSVQIDNSPSTSWTGWSTNSTGLASYVTYASNHIVDI